jgi:signal peptidase I
VYPAVVGGTQTRWPLQLRRRVPPLALCLPPKVDGNPSFAYCGVAKKGQNRFNSSVTSKEGNNTHYAPAQRPATKPPKNGPRIRSVRDPTNRSARKSPPPSSLPPTSRTGAPFPPPAPALPPPAISSSPSSFVQATLRRVAGGGSGRGSGSGRTTATLSWTFEHVKAAAFRVPLWVAAAFLALLCDETAPVAVISVVGPSMVPTMAADRTDAWLVLRYPTFWRSRPVVAPRLAVGDLVGVQVPFYNSSLDNENNNNNNPEDTSKTGGGGGAVAVVSCKRVVGVEGDVVKRYGQFVHLFVSQDPTGHGVVWPDHNDGDSNSVLEHHRHLDPSCPWDAADRDKILDDPHRTLVVPPGHVWVEGDCPGLAVDSRHYGPVPLEAVRGKVVARLWPLHHRPEMNHRHYRRRPHPIPLDDDTLRQYNVHWLKEPPPSRDG